MTKADVGLVRSTCDHYFLVHWYVAVFGVLVFPTKLMRYSQLSWQYVSDPLSLLGFSEDRI